MFRLHVRNDLIHREMSFKNSFGNLTVPISSYCFLNLFVKILVCWDVMPCDFVWSFLRVNCIPCLSHRIIRRAPQFSTSIPIGPLFRSLSLFIPSNMHNLPHDLLFSVCPEDRSCTLLRNIGNCASLYGVTGRFLNTALRTSNRQVFH